MFQQSICSYAKRLNYGDSRYRGNTSGGIIKDFLQLRHRNPKGLFVDPMQGGGTSRDVAAELNIPYKGLDLKSGFNIIKDDLGQALGQSAETIFCHPPYWQMIRYSSHAEDLSNMTLDKFLENLHLAMRNVYDALRAGGSYAVLMGNYRSKGTYYPLCSMTLSICPGKLKEEIIKVQHNCQSDYREYSGAGISFVPIKHETMYILEKSAAPITLMDCTIKVYQATWRVAIKRILQKNGKAMTLEEIYRQVATVEKDKTQKNLNWKAKVRQIVGQNPEFQRIETGYYALA